MSGYNKDTKDESYGKVVAIVNEVNAIPLVDLAVKMPGLLYFTLYRRVRELADVGLIKLEKIHGLLVCCAIDKELKFQLTE